MSLKINNLSKSFDDKLIFDGFSYEFNETGVYAVVGDSGIGKTTLLRMISGLDKSFNGKITGGGAENCSYLFQEHRLFPNLTALDNVLLANFDKPSEENRKEAIDLFFKLKFTEGDLQLMPSELSGGMKQRVSLVRALMKKAPILLLDEPTKELDATLCDILYDIIEEESKERLVIVVSHSEKDVEALEAKVITI